ncbi:hypothetical protein PMAYCL1PPCAC_32638, partial [Pristionchus mayeri]
ESQVVLPPPVTQTAAVIPAPIPMDYGTNTPKPETEDKGMMTDPWDGPDPVIIYRKREPEPKVDYDSEERMMLPPAPITACSEAPQFMESEDEDPMQGRVVVAPIPVILKPQRRRADSPPLQSPRAPFPALPRRALDDVDLLPQRQPKEKKTRTRPTLKPVVFLHNAKPEERPFMEEPEEPAQPAASRGPRAFPPPPPVSRTSASPEARTFPAQFKSPSPGPKPSQPLPSTPPAETNYRMAPPGPKASRRLPSPPPAEPAKRAASLHEPIIPPKQSRPLTRTPMNRPVIMQEPTLSNERRSAQPPPPAA